MEGRDEHPDRSPYATRSHKGDGYWNGEERLRFRRCQEDPPELGRLRSLRRNNLREFPRFEARRVSPNLRPHENGTLRQILRTTQGPRIPRMHHEARRGEGAYLGANQSPYNQRSRRPQQHHVCPSIDGRPTTKERSTIHPRTQ